MTHLRLMKDSMNKKWAKAFAVVALAFGLGGCAATGHAFQPATLGTPRASHDLEAHVDEPGVVEVETVLGADWSVDLSGLLNLDDPTARAAHLEDRVEPIQIFFHAIRHPTRGTYLVDTGVERALR